LIDLLIAERPSANIPYIFSTVSLARSQVQTYLVKWKTI